MRRFFVFALLLHVALLFAASRVKKTVVDEEIPISLVELPTETDEVVVPPSPQQTMPTSGASSGSNNAVAMATNPSAGSRALPNVQQPPLPPEVLTAAPTASAADWSFSGTGRPTAAAIGLDGKNVLLANGMVPPLGSGEGPQAVAQADGPPPVPGAALMQNITMSLHAADVAKGLGASGPVITQLENVTRQSLIPVASKGTFVVEANSDGDVINVSANGNGGDASAWTELASELMKSMQGKKVRVPHGWNGIKMVVALDSHIAKPSGATSAASVDGLGLRSDLSDIGAKEHRVVSVRVINELPL